LKKRRIFDQGRRGFVVRNRLTIKKGLDGVKKLAARCGPKKGFTGSRAEFAVGEYSRRKRTQQSPRS